MGILEGKVIIITGATSGIGEATAEEAASEGAKVVLAGRRTEKGEAIVERIKKKGQNATFIATDVTKEEDIKNLVEQTVKLHGKLDGAFNNAGILSGMSTVDTCEFEQFDNQLKVNLYSVFHCMKYQVTAMKSNAGGSILNCGSIASIVAAPAFSPYVVSKFGVKGLTKATSLDHAADNIRVNSICPGPIETEIWNPDEVGADLLKVFGDATPMKRYAQPGEIAKPAVFLLSDGASYITGTELIVDGGYTAQ
ncbi:MAG: SDR family oxidoreductase [Leptospirales bacterium]